MEQLADGASTFGGGWQVVQFVAAVLLVCFLAIAATRLLGRRLSGQTSGSYLHVVETVTLGQNRSLCLAWVAGELLVLGVTEHQVTRLAKVKELRDDWDPGLSGANPRGKFWDKLMDALARRGEEPRCVSDEEFKYLGRML